MKCETIRNMMSSYIDSDLNDIEKAELEKHLAECNECREEYESLLDIVTVCGNLEELELPQNFRTELHQRLLEEKKKKHFFGRFRGSKSMKMTAGLVAAVLVIVIGIGSSSLLNYKSTSMPEEIAEAPGYGGAAAPAPAPAAVPPDYYDIGSDKNKAEGREYEAAAAAQPRITSSDGNAVAMDSVTMQFNESLAAENAVPDQKIVSSRSGRMVIKTGNISINVENVDKAVAEIRQLTESSGGYVENSHVEIITTPQVKDVGGRTAVQEAEEKYANMTVRVPETRFDDIFNSVKGMGKLVSENVSGSDITAEYRDTAARVDNLKIQEQSLKQLMAKAKSVDEILKIETELNRVRTEIDIHSGNLKRWDDLVRLSTIHIYIRELKPEELKSVDVPGMWEKAYQGFIKAVNNVVEGFENIVILLVTALPYLLVIGAVAAVGYKVFKKIRKKKE